jgi:autotransporter-associated beta strand protein
MPLTINGGNLEYLGSFGSNILDGLITLNASSVTFNSSWTEGLLSINGGVFGLNMNLELLNDGGFANIWIRQAPLNLGNGQLNGYGWHLAVPGNIAGTIHPYYGRSTYLETDNAFVGSPNLVIGNPSWGQLDLNGHSLSVNSLSNPANNGTADVVTSAAAAALTISNSADCTYGGLLSGAGLALTKAGSRTLSLSGTNTYGGNTLVNGGTLALNTASAGSPIPNSPVLSIGPGACLDVSGVAAGFTLASGQTLEGAGTVKGNCSLGGGSSLAPGNSIGTLTFSNSLTLLAGSKTIIELSTAPRTNDMLLVLGTLTFGGTLIVTNSGTLAPAEGDSFQLFSAGAFSGQFGSLQLVSPGQGLAWDTSQLASRGLLKVISIKPKFGACRVSGTNFVAGGTSGPANGAYVELCSTNLTLPLSQWVRVATNYFDSSGAFGFTNPVNRSSSPQFFRLELH